MLLISILNIAFNVATWYYVIIAVIFCTALQFAFDASIAIIVSKIPDKFFNYNSWLYKVTNFEQKFYKKIKVKSWKNKVWELGGLGGFSKKNLAKPNSPEYYKKFIIESSKGVLTHRLSYFVGFLAMLFFNNICAFTIAVPVATVNLILNALPTIVLRYNTPKLVFAFNKLEKKIKKQ